MEDYKFRVDFLEEAKEFLDCLDGKTREKIFYLFAFWDKADKIDAIVISTHGLIKKTNKVPKNEIERAERLREKYFNEKTSKK